NLELLTVDNHADGAWLYLKLKKENPRLAEKAFNLLLKQGGNSSGIRIGAVDNFGFIYPDQFWRAHKLGNIRSRRFSEVWKDAHNDFLQALRNRKVLLKGRCKRCNFIDICNGNFRARAEALSGDPWAEDPACYLTEDEIQTRIGIPMRVWKMGYEDAFVNS
ncbi:MAG TPA: SPASM domain-containing protein, partial [Candidatus Omnitrophota bacterium]|nr:SPASM domain-containing protein [Candidatus Omnitrophota bacterium]